MTKVTADVKSLEEFQLISSDLVCELLGGISQGALRRLVATGKISPPVPLGARSKKNFFIQKRIAADIQRLQKIADEERAA